MNSSIYVTIDYLREVIAGKIHFRKCTLCDNNGLEIQAYDDDGNPCAHDHPEAERYVCEACGGLAFIELHDDE